MQKVLIYTDGACSGNPGPGGWGAILQLEGTNHRRELCGGYRLTTNNRMEIMAALEALSALRRACEVVICTDSQYLSDAIAKGWLHGWRSRNFVRKNNKPVPNADLWRLLLPLLATHRVSMTWVRGHTGHPENERCDELARLSSQKPDLPPDTGYESMLAQKAARPSLI
ncbi:MAG: ribonuclease HI [Desulfovibrio sp.]|nr:ribonuclease HI [Desulfovibrio sp.]